MKRKITFVTILLAVCLFLQIPASAYYYRENPMDLYVYVCAYVPDYYYNEYLNATADNYAEAKMYCANEFAPFLDYEDSDNLYSHPEPDYTKPWSNGPEASDRTMYIQHGHVYDSMSLFRNESGEATHWTYYYFCDESARSSDYYIEWDGWAGHSMEFDMYFRYPGLVFVQDVGDTSGDVANILIVVE